jgi:hypothetical protein
MQAIRKASEHHISDLFAPKHDSHAPVSPAHSSQTQTQTHDQTQIQHPQSPAHSNNNHNQTHPKLARKASLSDADV